MTTTRPSTETVASPLMAVRLAAFIRARADLDLAAAVGVARAAKVSWRAVGHTIGMSSAMARQRYGGQDAPPSSVSFLRSVAEGALSEGLARSEMDPDAVTRP
jgi:hypothetical protein